MGTTRSLVFVTALATVFLTGLLLFNLCFMKLKKELKVDTTVRSTFDKWKASSKCSHLAACGAGSWTNTQVYWKHGKLGWENLILFSPSLDFLLASVIYGGFRTCVTRTAEVSSVSFFSNFFLFSILLLLRQCESYHPARRYTWSQIALVYSSCTVAVLFFFFHFPIHGPGYLLKVQESSPWYDFL